MTSPEERLARLEEKSVFILNQIKEHMDNEEEQIKDLKKEINNIRDAITEIKEGISKRAGFAMGIATAVTVVWGFITGGGYLAYKIFGGGS